jgi:hypothetical protein
MFPVMDSLDVMQAANHKNYNVAARYMQDAKAIAQINRCNADPKQAVGSWRSPYCAGNETAVKSTQPGHQWKVDLPVLVVGFIERVVGVNPNHPE